MDQITFALLTSVVLLGKFGDYLLQSPLAEATSQAGGEDRPAQSFLSNAIVGAHGYLVDVFKLGFWNKTRLWRVLLVSAFLVQGSFLFSSLIVPEVWSVKDHGFPFIEILATVVLLILVNFAFDLVAISLIIELLERTIRMRQKSGSLVILRYVGVSLLVVAAFYMIVLTIMNLSFSFILHMQGLVAGYDQLFSWSEAFSMHWAILVSETEWRYLDPVREGRYLGVNGVNLLVFSLTPLLPLALLVAVVATGAVLDIMDAAAAGRVRRLFHGFGADRRPFFLKLASILAILGAGAATLLSA